MRFSWPFYDFIVNVRHVPIHILIFNFMFSYVNFIIKDDAV
jgi:hypothetical protein